LGDFWIWILAEDYNADICWLKAVEGAANVGPFWRFLKWTVSTSWPDLRIVCDLKGFRDRLEIWSRAFNKKSLPAGPLGYVLPPVWIQVSEHSFS
jgi:hypothetical protein